MSNGLGKDEGDIWKHPENRNLDEKLVYIILDATIVI